MKVPLKYVHVTGRLQGYINTVIFNIAIAIGEVAAFPVMITWCQRWCSTWVGKKIKHLYFQYSTFRMLRYEKLFSPR